MLAHTGASSCNPKYSALCCWNCLWNFQFQQLKLMRHWHLNVQNNDFFKAQGIPGKRNLIEIVLLIKFCQNDRMYNPESSSKSTFIVRPRKYKPNRCQISVDLQFSLVSTLNFDVIVSLRVVFSLKLNNWFCLDYSTCSRATCNVDAISSAITLLADQEHKASIF